MITVVYGVPGSGKTYYAVWFIKKRALIDGDIFLRVREDVILITNLKLNLDSHENYIYIEDIKDFAKYLDVDFWRANFALLQGKKVYIVIDECQLFFYHYKDDQRVLFFLQYHRHLSVDILLITQTPKSLPAKIFELSEFLIEAVPKSVNPFHFGRFKSFRYRVLHPLDRGIVLRRFHLAFDVVVFHLYSDMIYKFEEGEEKTTNAFTRYYLFVASFVLLAVFSMFFFLSRVFSPSSPSSPSVSYSHQSMQYEDLIHEVPEVPDDNYISDKDISTKPSDIPKFDSPPKPKEEGFYYIEVEASGLNPKHEDVPKPKVIEIP